MFRLTIDTTNFERAYLKLWQGRKLLVKTSFKAQKKLSDKLLPAIIKLSKKAGILLERLNSIEVAKSETGSFTGQRVGMAVAKALGFGLGIKVAPAKKPRSFPERAGVQSPESRVLGTKGDRCDLIRR